MIKSLETKIIEFLNNPKGTASNGLALFKKLVANLEQGAIRAAEPTKNGWRVNQWVKAGILLGFKFGTLSKTAGGFFDKDSLPPHKFKLIDKVRLVTGGSAVRCGSFIASGTIIMPPSYINIGAYIDSGCMVDSHALVGSCAQIGKNVHISAASQVGGVLEPVGAMPVIIEDNVFIGGNCGIYEGVIVQQGAILGSGVILNSSTPIFDNTTGEFIKKTTSNPLTVPRNAVVIAGARPINQGHGQTANIHIYCPVIIKYRDRKTDAATELETILK
jgi:2,3,4,5-tetrahydropyridine-2-carboxylate N-succinyltransferase